MTGRSAAATAVFLAGGLGAGWLVARRTTHTAGHAVGAAAGPLPVEDLLRLAYTDPLTGLANRAGLTRAATTLLNPCPHPGMGKVRARYGRPAHAPGSSEWGPAGAGRVAGLLVDLDEFKPVNDGHGHAAGDAVLAEVGHRLLDLTRGPAPVGAGALAARLGGDEFLVQHPCDVDPAVAAAQATTAAGRLAVALTAPYDLGHGLVLRVGASVGVATVPTGATLGALLAGADLALYQAKAAGGGTVRLAPDDPDTAPPAPVMPPGRPAVRLRDHRPSRRIRHREVTVR